MFSFCVFALCFRFVFSLCVFVLCFRFVFSLCVFVLGFCFMFLLSVFVLKTPVKNPSELKNMSDRLLNRLLSLVRPADK